MNGMYMPADHNHEEWKEKKARYMENNGHRGKRQRDSDGGSSSKLKLALNQKLSTALVTQHHLSQNEADNLFNACYKEADEALN